MATDPPHPRVFVSQPDLTEEEARAVYDTVRSGRITQGSQVAQFQDLFAAHLGVRHALACSSGTTALHLALAALNVGPGDEVIVPDLSFVATANAVSYTGATPVLCDVGIGDWGLRLSAVRAAITPFTKAIVAVHLYGRPCRIDELRALADERGLWLVEDAAEGLGGYVDPSRKLGTIGHIGTFSFYGNKVITTGEGGMLVTDESVFHQRAYKLRGQGVHPTRRYYHDVLGFNYRMTDMQAALGVVQMRRLDSILLARQAVMHAYDRWLSFNLVTCSAPSPYYPQGRVAPWLYTILAPSRNHAQALFKVLDAAGYETRPVFVPMHQLVMYTTSQRSFPVSDDLHNRGVSLPTHTGLSGDDISEICSIVLDICA